MDTLVISQLLAASTLGAGHVKGGLDFAGAITEKNSRGMDQERIKEEFAGGGEFPKRKRTFLS